MVAYVFDKILADGVKAGQIPARTQQARDWFRSKAAGTRITPNRLLTTAKQKQTGSAVVTKIPPGINGIGRMYMFFYDPKTKKDMPYYDRFPLVFKIKDIDGGFLGLNLHYLPPVLRARLMDALYGLATNTRYDENTRLRLTYDRLNAARRFKWFKPTVKKYLFSHVRSRYILVDSVEWDMALFLPTERFIKAPKQTVWRESRRKI